MMREIGQRPRPAVPGQIVGRRDHLHAATTEPARDVAGRQLARDAQGQVDAFFADRLVLLNYQAESEHGRELVIPEKLFEVLPVALPMARGDADWQLAVDRALSRVQRNEAGQALYARYFGQPGEPGRQVLQLFQRPE